MDELLLTLLILTHRHFLLLLLLPHYGLNLAVEFHIDLISSKLHLKMDQPCEVLHFVEFWVDFDELLVDVVDYEDGRVFYGLLKDYLEVVLDEEIDDLQVLAEPQH